MTGESPKQPTSQEIPPRPTAAQAAAALREFLISYPLYRRLRVDLGQGAQLPPFPQSISAPCWQETCKGEPTTTWRLEDKVEVSPGVRLGYKCVHCEQALRSYWVVIHPLRQAFAQLPGGRIPRGFDVFQVQKIGQLPAWSIDPPKEVVRALAAADLALYRNALICMSQSYGLGALASFRRVVENTVGALLDLVEEAALGDNDTEALEAVRQARETRIADEKLRLVAAVVPATLRPGGVNPLSKLYQDYSRGLHALSDEEWLEIATELRDALEYVFGNLRDRLEQAKAYRAKITKHGGR